MLALFCLKANSKHNSMIAPMDNDINVDVIPDARYLSNTIKTKSEGANAHNPIIKLAVKSIVATDLSRNR
tara:strand:+ start:154 stop:363 length:210 start_codon:yes stop_codon:yes gene_type:complete